MSAKVKSSGRKSNRNASVKSPAREWIVASMENEQQASPEVTDIERNRRTAPANGRSEEDSLSGIPSPSDPLGRTEQRYAELFEFAPIPLISLDRSGRIEEANL